MGVEGRFPHKANCPPAPEGRSRATGKWSGRSGRSRILIRSTAAYAAMQLRDDVVNCVIYEHIVRESQKFVLKESTWTNTH